MTDDATRQTDDTQPVQTSPPPDVGSGSDEVSPAMASFTPDVDGADTSATTAAVSATPVAASAGPGRARWLVALGVAALTAIIAVGAFVVLSSQPTPEALKYIPGDALVVVEVRPELPGDQMQNLGNFLGHFPGFRDQSTLTEKLDEAFTQLVSRAGDPSRLDYMADIKPWLNGPAFISVRRPPGQSADGASSPPGFLVSATTNGQVSCASTFEGYPTTTETYNGVDVVLMAGSEYGCVVQGKQGLLGDRLTLRAALDAKSAGSGMDKNAQYAEARKAIVGDQLATAYVDAAALGTLLTEQGGFPVGENPLSKLSFGQFPAWAMQGLRAEGDKLVVESVSPTPPPPAGGPSLLPVPAAHASGIISLVPADAVAYVEVQGAGASLINAIRELRTIPEVDQSFQMLDGMVAMDDLLGWIEDVGIVVTGGETPAGGVILLARDDAGASQKATELSTLLALAALSGAEGIEVSETTVNGVKITTVTVTDASGIIPPGSLPVDPSSMGPVQLSYAVKGRAFIVGSGEAFITSLLNVPAGNGLGDQAGFKRVATRGVTPSSVIAYVSSPELIELVEGFVPATELGPWTSDIKPYVEPFEAVYVSSSVAAGMSRAVYVISVKQ